MLVIDWSPVRDVTILWVTIAKFFAESTILGIGVPTPVRIMEANIKKEWPENKEVIRKIIFAKRIRYGTYCDLFPDKNSRARSLIFVIFLPT